jgi:putative PIN family toxin of toxin-antitoxin system
VVLDTNVLVAALRSRRGASFRVVEAIGTGRYNLAVSVPLVLEYEDTMLRHRGSISVEAIRDIVDYVCSVAKRQEIFYLRRPLLRDPKDDMVAELAVAAGADAIVTHNLRDFGELKNFGIRVHRPRDFLKVIGGRA